MFEHGFIWSTLLLAFTLTKAALAATLVIYPSYKSYKALESRSLQAAQGMLLYWCMTAFVNSGKEMADQILGTYSNVYLWKLTVLVLKATPLIIGPERMYTHIIKPLFDANADQVDAVVDEAHKIKSMAKDAVPAVKERDMAAVKSKAGAIAAEVKDATGELVESAMASLSETTAALQEKTEALGVTLNKEGAMAVLTQLMTGVETARDAGVDVAAGQWKTHGPFISKQAGIARAKGTELYTTHAPVVQQKAIAVWQEQVLPRVQPAITAVNDKYQQSVKPVIVAQTEKAQSLWQAHGGPVRTFWTTKAQPFYTNQLKPFVLHSFLPAVWETIIALKDRIVDTISPPSAELQSQRAAHKLRRREANEKRAQWKRRGDKVKDKWAGEWKEVEAEGSNAASSAQDAFNSAANATLTNRKTKATTDSSLERHHTVTADESELNPAAPTFEPSAPLATESLLTKEVIPAVVLVAEPKQLQGDKLAKSNSGDKLKEQDEFVGERSGRIVEPIQ